MNSRLQVLQLLTSHCSRLLISEDEYREALLHFVPLISDIGTSIYKDDIKYKEVVHCELESISSGNNIYLSDDFNSDELNPGTLAYHRIRGLITSGSYWYFSTKEFEQDLLRAEVNPNITCHFVHITSGGGEAWYLDRLSDTIRSLSKPFYVLIEKTCGSAAYYIGCHGAVIRTLTQNDTIGCIGTMISFWDLEPYFETLGLKKIEEYATGSDLKNKKYNDLRHDKPEQFINEELDPLQIQFKDEVKKCRKQIRTLPDDHPVLRGETYLGSTAKDVGLIDGLCTFNEAIEEAHALGKKWQDSVSKQRNRALSLI